MLAQPVHNSCPGLILLQVSLLLKPSHTTLCVVKYHSLQTHPGATLDVGTWGSLLSVGRDRFVSPGHDTLLQVLQYYFLQGDKGVLNDSGRGNLVISQESPFP